MEAAPLTRAHAHASKATHQQTLHNFKLASQEHKEAADEFGKAEKETEDPEALRTLSLLQQHHKDLSSRLLASTVQTPPTPPPSQTSFLGEKSAMAKPVTMTATTFSPPTSPKHRPPPLFSPDTAKPESPQNERPQMFFQPSTPTTPSTSDNPSHPHGTRKIAPAPMPLPSPTANITTQTLTFMSARGEPVLPSPNPYTLANNLANARGIRSPVRGRSPAAGVVDRNFLQVRDPEPGGRAASAGGTVRGTSPVLLGAPPKRERRKSAGALSPVVGPREALPFDNFKKPTSDGPVRPAVKEFDSSSIRSTSPAPPKLDDAFTKFYSQFEGYIEAVGNPLAFAGLPLNGDMSSMDPALKKAVAEKGAAESFYVVPTTGGTMSYAGILTRNQQQSKDEKIETAVTAQSSEPIPSEKQLNAKTREELEFENAQLRQLTDMMAHKLHTWETSAKANAAKMRESLQVFKETSHNSPTTDAFEADRGFGKMRGLGKLGDVPMRLGGRTETRTLTLPDARDEYEPPSTPKLAPRMLTLPGKKNIATTTIEDDYEMPKTPRFGGGFPEDMRDDKKFGRGVSPNPSGKSRGISPMPAKLRALSPAPSAILDNPTVEELQAELAKLRQHESKILKENDKLKTVVGKYRDRWEKLKEGARARRAEQETGDDTESVKTETTIDSKKA